MHDICVRYVSQRNGILHALTSVLVTGPIVLIPVTLMFGGWQDMAAESYGFSTLSGLCYVFGCLGLYKSFAIGPVRLVAPITGAYPILWVRWSVLQGQVVPIDLWLAVGAVVAGVAVVSTLSDQEDSNGSQSAAIGWAIMGSVGFALTFAISHIATISGAGLPVVFVTRVATAGCQACLLLTTQAPNTPERKAWPLLTLMAMLDTFALGIVIASDGLDRREFAAFTASTFGMLRIILAWGFLKKRMSASQWGGIALTFAGIGYLAL